MLPHNEQRFRELSGDVDDRVSGRFSLAELNTFLTGLSRLELRPAVSTPPPATLSAYSSNYVAAMVEYVCGRRDIDPPAWTRSIEVLPEPQFGTALQSLRLHLLTCSPPPFRRRNIFVDTSIGGQV